jgi:hypothetical protein
MYRLGSHLSQINLWSRRGAPSLRTWAGSYVPSKSKQARWPPVYDNRHVACRSNSHSSPGQRQLSRYATKELEYTFQRRSAMCARNVWLLCTGKGVNWVQSKSLSKSMAMSSFWLSCPGGIVVAFHCGCCFLMHGTHLP